MVQLIDLTETNTPLASAMSGTVLGVDAVGGGVDVLLSSSLEQEARKANAGSSNKMQFLFMGFGFVEAI